MMMESMRNLHIVLMLVVVSVVQTMAQACPYSDPRCTCDPPSLTCNHLDKIPPLNTGVSGSQIKDLAFEYGGITSIPSSSLPPGLSSLYLDRHPIADISENAFDTSAATLSRVSIIGGHFTNFPTALKKLTALTHLQLVNTPIQIWDTTTLEPLAASLQSLQLSNVGLSAWPSWISDFHLLHIIDLNRNTLKSLPDDAFNFVKDKLMSLDLSETGLTQVPKALSTLSALDTLFLSYNNLTEASQFHTITGAPFASKLLYLYLNSAGLTRAANFSNLTSLKVFSLTSNRISDIPAGSLPTSLTILLLSENSLSNVPEDVASMYRLKALYLNKNLITSIESNPFPSSLKYINLDFNNLTIITNTTFGNLNELRTLELRSNPISEVATGAFSDLELLGSLFFLNSQLTEIPLAFTLLNSETDLYWSSVQPVSCPCPAPNDLVQWYTSLTNASDLEATCNNNQSIDAYLSGNCGNTSATP